jgi:hypothetical protein
VSKTEAGMACRLPNQLERMTGLSMEDVDQRIASLLTVQIILEEGGTEGLCEELVRKGEAALRRQSGGPSPELGEALLGLRLYSRSGRELRAYRRRLGFE